MLPLFGYNVFKPETLYPHVWGIGVYILDDSYSRVVTIRWGYRGFKLYKELRRHKFERTDDQKKTDLKKGTDV